MISNKILMKKYSNVSCCPGMSTPDNKFQPLYIILKMYMVNLILLILIKFTIL